VIGACQFEERARAHGHDLETFPPRDLYAPESLEARIAPATIVVISLLDNNGAGTTLREAVVAANLTATAVNLIATVIANNIAPTDPNRSGLFLP
jgi:hypothetical protein